MMRMYNGIQGNAQQRARDDTKGAWQEAKSELSGKETKFSIRVSAAENRMGRSQEKAGCQRDPVAIIQRYKSIIQRMMIVSADCLFNIHLHFFFSHKKERRKKKGEGNEEEKEEEWTEKEKE